MNASSPALERGVLPAHWTGSSDGVPQFVQTPALPRQMELRDLALDRIRQGLCVFDGEQRLLLFNRRYATMYDLDPGQLRIGMTLRDVVDLRYAAGTGPGMPPEEYATWRERIHGTNQVVDTEVTLRDGRVHAIHHEPTGGGSWVATFEDITERRRAEARVRHMAHHDALTGLPSRILFTERLEQTLARLRGESRPEDHRAPAAEGWLVAVLFLDLDNFKDVNDTLGHAAGDLLLQLVAGRISLCLRDEDTLTRLGGDEFAVLLDGGIINAEQAAEVAQRVISAVSAPYMLDGHETLVGASLGIALCVSDDEEGADSARLLRQADMALYQAKAKGRGTYCFFQAGMHASLHRRKGMERDLRRALAEGGLAVHFQPIMALATPRRIIGAEALVRWDHPEHGMVPPAEFIPLAESMGLIGELGAWVLRTACARAARWKGISLAVNLSPEQLRQPGLAELVAAVLAEAGLPASRLELEITEGVLLQDTAATLGTLTRLRTLGVGIVLDDFGTGYSSLSYLRRFPFSKLKVDRGFVASMTTDAGTAAIVQAMVTIGRSLDMRVNAEGVETEKQLALLRAMGCDEVQGYLLGRPCPAESFEQMIALKST